MQAVITNTYNNNNNNDNNNNANNSNNDNNKYIYNSILSLETSNAWSQTAWIELGMRAKQNLVKSSKLF